MSGTITINSNDLLNAVKPQLLQMPEITQQPYSYIIWTDGTKYYAKNGSTGQIEYSDLDASVTINYALSKIGLIGGGKIDIRRGTYILTQSLQPTSNTVIEGEGAGTILKLGDGTSIHAIYIKNASNILISNIAFDGNSANVGNVDSNTKSIGIYTIGNSSNILVTNCFFYNFKSHAIRPDENTVGFHVRNSVFYNNNFWDIALCMGGPLAPDGTAYRLPGSVVGCSFIDTKGVEIAYTHDVLIANNYFRNASIYADLSKRSTIIGNTIIDDRYGTSSIEISSNSTNNLILGNRITGTQGTGIALRSSYNLVAFNYISRGWRGIYEIGTANYNYIYYNYVAGHSIANIVKVGANTIVKNNIGYTTENGGTATFSGDDTTAQFKIMHNLVSTPSKIMVTPGSNDAKGTFYVTADDTYIYVNYATAPPTGTNNIVLYWYAEV